MSLEKVQEILIEILQEGNLEPKEPWASMENTGTW